MFHKAEKLLFFHSPAWQKDELPCYLQFVLQSDSLATWLKSNPWQFILQLNIADFIQSDYIQQHLSVQYFSGSAFSLCTYSQPSRITFMSTNMNQMSKKHALFYHFPFYITDGCRSQMLIGDEQTVNKYSMDSGFLVQFR